MLKHLVKQQLKSTRDAYGQAIVDLAKENNNIVAITADLKNSTRLSEFASIFPNRFFDVGLSEQDMIGIATGLALSGKIPFVSSFAIFSTGRCWEQIRNAVAMNNANVKIVSTHAGILTGPDGASHQMLEDIALIRCLPNFTIIAPADYEQTKKAIYAATEINGPVYIRLTRPKTEQITNEQQGFEIGKAQILNTGKDAAIIGYGPILNEAIKAAKKLRNEIDITIVNMHTIKPIDKDTIIHIAKQVNTIFTLEDHQIIGGLGSAVAEVIAHEKEQTKLVRIGIQGEFGVSGEPNKLIKKFGLGKDAIVNTIRKNIYYKHKTNV